MVSRQDITPTEGPAADEAAVSVNDLPTVFLPDASFLLEGTFEQVGFDLVITNPEGEVFIVEDYFSFNPPPYLLVASGAGLSPEMVAQLLHLPFGEDVMFAGPAVSATAGEVVGRVTLSLGDVTATRVDENGDQVVVQLKRGDALYTGDEINTGGRAFIKARMNDGTRFHLGKNSRATLDDYAYDESAKVGNFEATVFRGGFHYSSGNIGKMFGTSKNHSTISTPTAIIGVRGSKLDLFVDEQGHTTVRHGEGILTVSDIFSREEVVLDTQDETSLITFSGPPSKSSEPTAEQLQAFVDNLPPPDTPEEIARDDAEAEAAREEEAPPEETREDVEAPREEEPQPDETVAEETEEEPEEETEEVEEEEAEDEEVEEEEPEEERAEDDTEEERAEEEAEEAAEERVAEETAEEPAEEEPVDEVAAEEERSAEEAPEESGEEPAEERVADESAEEPAIDDPVVAEGPQDEAIDDGAPRDEIAPGDEVAPDEDSGLDIEGRLAESGEPGVEAPAEDGGLTEGAEPPVTVDDGLGRDEPGAEFADEPAAPDDGTEGPQVIEIATETLSLEGVTARQQQFGVDESVNVLDPTASITTGTGANPGEDAGLEQDGDTDDRIDILDVPETEIVEEETREPEPEPEPIKEEIPPDNPPVAENDFLRVRVAETVEIGERLLSNDFDGDEGQVPVIVAASDPEDEFGNLGGQLEFIDDRLFYTPNAATLNGLFHEATKTETFNYQIQSGDLTDTATVTVILVGTNFAPTAESDSAATSEDEPITLLVVDNDSDPDGDTLRVIEVEGARGTVNIRGGSIVYDPPDDLNQGEVGEDVFTYTVSDGEFTATATVTVEITGRNDPPVINTEEPVQVAAGAEETVIPLDAIFADSDLGDELEILEIDTSDTLGTITIGSIIFTPGPAWAFLPAGGVGHDSFFIRVQDQFGATGSGTYTIEIIGENDAPVANRDQYGVVSGETFVTSAFNSLLDNDVDVDEGDVLSAELIEGPSNAERFSLNPDGSFTYRPAEGFVGTDSFTYQAVDQGGLSSAATVFLSVGATNNPPIANPDTFTVGVNSSIAGNVLLNDVELEGEPVIASPGTPPEFGTLEISSTGDFVYEPDVNAAGVDTFTYFVTDFGGRSSEGVVTINIVGENQPPVIVEEPGPQEVQADDVFAIDLTTVFIDPEDSVLSFSFEGGEGIVTLSGSVLEVSPTEAEVGLNIPIQISASDGENTVFTEFTLDIVPANLAPVVDQPLSNQFFFTNAPFDLDITGVFSDPDDDPLTFSLDSDAPFPITLTGLSLSASPGNADEGTYLVTITASDGLAETTDTFQLTIDEPPPVVNPTVVLSGDQKSGTQSVTFGSTLVVNDLDGFNAAPFSIGTQGSLGTASIDPSTGVWDYTPLFSVVGTDSFTVNVVDGIGSVTTVTIDVNIRPPDNPTVLVGGDAGVGSEDNTITGTLTVTDIDTLSDMPFTIDPGTPGTNGVATVDPVSGAWEYVPDLDFNGTDTFNIVVTDSLNYTQTFPVSITVNPVNDAPVITAPGSINATEDTLFPVTGLSIDDVDVEAGNLFVQVFTSDGTIGFSTPPAIGYLAPDSFASGQLGAAFGASDPNVFLRINFVGGTLDATLSPTDISVTENAVTTTGTIVGGGEATDNFVIVQLTSPAGDPFQPSSEVNVNFDIQVLVNLAVESEVYSSLGNALSETGGLGSDPGLSVFSQNLVVQGTQADINTALGDLFLLSKPDETTTSTGTFSVFVDDLGNTGGPNEIDSVGLPLTISPVDDAPVANAHDFGNILEDSGGLFIDTSFFAFDPDGGPPVTVTQIDGSGITAGGTSVTVADGTVSLLADGFTLFFTPDADYSGPTSFSYTVSDGALTDTGSITGTVDPVNDTPTFVPPLVLGDPVIGNTLNADISSLADADGITFGSTNFTYTWLRDGAPITGSTVTTTNTADAYVTVSDDVGRLITVRIDFNDDGGNPETVESESVEIFSQDPFVSGTDTYHLTNLFEDFVLGSTGNDTITLVGLGEAGDEIDLDEGVDTLILDNLGNDLIIDDVENITGGTGLDSVSHLGFISKATNGTSVSGLFPATLENFNNGGYIQVIDDAFSYAGQFNNSSTVTSTFVGTLDIYGQTSPSSVTFTTFSTNNGAILLDGDAGATLTISSPFTNEDTVLSLDSDSGAVSPHTLDADYTNGPLGVLDVLHSLSFQPGNTVDLRDGSVFVNGGQDLTINDGTLLVGSLTSIFGDGTLSIDGTSTISLDSTFTFTSDMPDLDFSAGTSVLIANDFGTQTFFVSNGAFLTVHDDVTFNTHFHNEGDALFLGTNVINGTAVNGPGGILTVDGTSPGSLTINNNFTNSNTFTIDNSSAGADITDVAVTGTFNNFGEMIVQDTNGGAPAHGFYVTTISGGGLITLLADLELTYSGVSSITSDNTIDLGSNTLRITGSPTFINNGTISGAGSIENTNTTTTTIVNAGFLIPEDTPGAPATLNILGDFSNSGTIELDIYGAGPDVIAITGDNASGGFLNLDFQAGHGVGNGSRIENWITWTTGAAPLPGNYTVSHNLGAAFNVDVVVDQTFTTIFDFTVTANFTDSFDNGSADLRWETPSNWDLDLLPTITSDVQISGDFDVTKTTTTVESINSLFLEDPNPTDTMSTSLTISDGAISIADNSRALEGTVVALQGGALEVTSGTLTIDGLLDWDNGTVGTGLGANVEVLGTLDLDIGATTSLTTTIDIFGNATVDSSGNTLNGSGDLVNHGSTIIQGTLSVNPSLANKPGGTLIIQSNGAPTALTMLNGPAGFDFFNDGGLVVIDTAGTGTHSVTITMSSGSTLQNEGTILISDTVGNGALMTLVAPDSDLFVNNGFIDVDTDVTVDIDGSTLDSEFGSIDIAAGKTLTIAGGTLGTLEIGGGANISGTGTLAFTGNVNLDLVSGVFLDAPGIFFDTTNGDLSITGSSLSINNGTVLGLDSGDSVSTTILDNFGTLDLSGNNVLIDAPTTNFGTLQLIGGTGTGTKTFSSTLINQGSLILNQDGNNVLDVNSAGLGTVNNLSYLQSIQTSGAAPNVIQAQLVNESGGVVDVDYSLELSESVVASHDNFGTIDIASGATLTVTGSGHSLTNHFTGIIQGHGTLDVQGTGVSFTNDGILVAGYNDNLTGATLTIAANASTVLGEDSELKLEIDPGAAQIDRFVFTGATNPVFNGRLSIAPVNASIPTNGQVFNIVWTVAPMMTYFDHIDGTDEFSGGSGYVYEVDLGTSGPAFGVFLTAVDAANIIKGSAGDDNLGGTGASGEVFHGDDGDDVIIDISTDDTAFGGAGDDTIETDANFKRVVGGDGTDTLRLLDSVDYRTIAGHVIEEFEILDIDDSVGQTVQFDADAIAKFIDDEHGSFEDSIIILGDPDDHVILHGDFDNIGSHFLDIRVPDTFEEFFELEEFTGSEHAGVLIDQQALVEVQRTDGSKHFYGSAGNDAITETQTTDENDLILGRDGDDQIDGGLGDDFVDGGLGADVVDGGAGNDTIVHDAADNTIDGGNGIDTLLVGENVNLSGVGNLANLEEISIRGNGTGTDTLTLGIADIPGLVGDNSLDSLLPDGRTKLIIDGDTGDTVMLDGNAINESTDVGSMVDDWSAPNLGSEIDYFGTGELYVKFTNGAVDLYVHADVVDVT